MIKTKLAPGLQFSAQNANGACKSSYILRSNYENDEFNLPPQGNR